MRIQASALNREIEKELKSLAKVTKSKVETATKKAAEAAKRVIAEKAPRPKGRRAKYAPSWRITSEAKRGTVSHTVHSPKYYRLAHLLEYDHVTGPRRKGYYRAGSRVHLSPAMDKAQKVLDDELGGVK